MLSKLASMGAVTAIVASIAVFGVLSTPVSASAAAIEPPGVNVPWIQQNQIITGLNDRYEPINLYGNVSPLPITFVGKLPVPGWEVIAPVQGSYLLNENKKYCDAIDDGYFVPSTSKHGFKCGLDEGFANIGGVAVNYNNISSGQYLTASAGAEGLGSYNPCKAINSGTTNHTVAGALIDENPGDCTVARFVDPTDSTRWVQFSNVQYSASSGTVKNRQTFTVTWNNLTAARGVNMYRGMNCNGGWTTTGNQSWWNGTNVGGDLFNISPSGTANMVYQCTPGQIAYGTMVSNPVNVGGNPTSGSPPPGSYYPIKSPNFVTPPTGSVLGTLISIYTCMDNTVTKYMNPMILITGIKVPIPKPSTSPCAEGIVAGLKFEWESENGLKKLIEDGLTDGMRLAMEGQGECFNGDKTCTVDISKGLKDGQCGSQAQYCPDFWNDPNKDEDYKCTYGGVEVDPFVCGMYRGGDGPTGNQGDDGEPSDDTPPSPNPGEAACNPPSFLEGINPYWIQKGVECAIGELFEPDQKKTDQKVAQMTDAWDSTIVGDMAGLINQFNDDFPELNGCLGPHVDFTIDLGTVISGFVVNVDAYPINACVAPLDSFAFLIKGVGNVFLAVASLNAIIRYIAGIISYPGMGSRIEISADGKVS